MVAFGKTAAQYQEERGNDDEVWIKGFRDGETRVRILVEPDDMVTFREHYDEGVGYFPCSEEKDCVGCTDDNQKVRQRSRRFAFPALDERGNQQVYKVGSRVHRSLQSKQQRLGTIRDRDYTVVRSGKNFNEITYDLEPGEKYAVEVPDDLFNVGEILAKKYADTVEAYTGTRPTDVEVLTPPTPAPAAATNGQAKTSTTKAAPAQQELSEPDTESGSADEAQVQTHSQAYPKAVEMPTKDLKDYLTERKVEFPERAPRSRLIKMVDDWQKEHPSF